MNKIKLQKILEDHRKWIKDPSTGTCADLSGAYLYRADLHDANLAGAYLYRADLRYADIRYANLRYANLTGANLRRADLTGADLSGAGLSGANLWHVDLSGADLRCADLRGADLYGANLSGADLRCADLPGADLRGAKTDENTKGFHLVCPAEGEFVGWKKAAGLIVKLKVPAGAKRSSATARKCRCSKAEVLAIEELNGTPSAQTRVSSDRDTYFVYEIGKTVEVENFDEDRWRECSAGIHFFMTREEAVDWV